MKNTLTLLHKRNSHTHTHTHSNTHSESGDTLQCCVFGFSRKHQVQQEVEVEKVHGVIKGVLETLVEVQGVLE